MLCLYLAVAVEGSQSAVSRAVRVAHDVSARGLVQQDGHAHLLEDEITLKVVARGSQRLRASGDHDHVRAKDATLLQKFVHNRANALVKAGEYDRIGYIRLGWGVEMEGLFHGRM